jgi:hypothetical protein
VFSQTATFGISVVALVFAIWWGPLKQGLEEKDFVPIKAHIYMKYGMDLVEIMMNEEFGKRIHYQCHCLLDG